MTKLGQPQLVQPARALVLRRVLQRVLHQGFEGFKKELHVISVAAVGAPSIQLAHVT